MLELSDKTHLLEQDTYKYSLQDVEEPNLYREYYSYEDVPRVVFNHRRVPMGMPADIWITDTSLRDGQQSVEPYTVKQIVDLYMYSSAACFVLKDSSYSSLVINLGMIPCRSRSRVYSSGLAMYVGL